jgi:hypothetical protein
MLGDLLEVACNSSMCRSLNLKGKSHALASRDRIQRTITTTPLLFASVVNLQSFHFLTATILVPLKGMMVLVRDLDY